MMISLFAARTLDLDTSVDDDTVIIRTIGLAPVYHIGCDITQPVNQSLALDEAFSVLKDSILNDLYQSPQYSENVRRGQILKKLLISVETLSDDEVQELTVEAELRKVVKPDQPSYFRRLLDAARGTGR